MAEEEVKKEAEQPAEETKPAEAATDAEPSAEQAASAEQPGSEAQPDSEVQPEAGAANAAQAATSEVDWKLQYARLLADFDNYKKRAARDRDDTYRYVESQVLKDLLPSVDNLAIALDKAESKDDPFVKGVKLVYDGILAMLKDHGAEPFDSVGLALDTERMEAIAQLPSPDVEEGKVSIESKKGWLLKGKVLRAAQVVVSSGKPA